MECLKLSDRERAILHGLYLGLSRSEIAAALGTNSVNIGNILSRLSRRSNCQDCVQLIVRYIEEYMGIGEPYPRCHWTGYLEAHPVLKVKVKAVAA